MTEMARLSADQPVLPKVVSSKDSGQERALKGPSLELGTATVAIAHAGNAGIDAGAVQKGTESGGLAANWFSLSTSLASLADTTVTVKSD